MQPLSNPVDGYTFFYWYVYVPVQLVRGNKVCTTRITPELKNAGSLRHLALCLLSQCSNLLTHPYRMQLNALQQLIC